MEIELTRAILKSRFSIFFEKFDHHFLHVFIFGNMFPESQRFVAVPYLDTWILGVASKQLRLLHGRDGDSTIVVNFLSPQMKELVEDAIAF